MSLAEDIKMGVLVKGRGIGHIGFYPDSGGRRVIVTCKEMGRAQVVVLDRTQIEELATELAAMAERMR